MLTKKKKNCLSEQSKFEKFELKYFNENQYQPVTCANQGVKDGVGQRSMDE